MSFPFIPEPVSVSLTQVARNPMLLKFWLQEGKRLGILPQCEILLAKHYDEHPEDLPIPILDLLFPSGAPPSEGERMFDRIELATIEKALEEHVKTHEGRLKILVSSESKMVKARYLRSVYALQRKTRDLFKQSEEGHKTPLDPGAGDADG